MPKRFEGKQLHANSVDVRFAMSRAGRRGLQLRSITAACGRNLFTSDGLYVGTLLDGGSKLGPAALWGESQPYFYQAPDGTPYVINGGNQAEHVFQIKGLEKGSVGPLRGELSAERGRRAEGRRDARRCPPRRRRPGRCWP